MLVGTRGSRLALAQARMVVAMLTEETPGVEFRVVPVRTLGDRLPAEKRSETDGKGAFTGDIEVMLARGELDLAVHSLKDLPTELERGLKIGATPPRGDARDALVSRNGERLQSMPAGATIGTSSIRRKAQLLNIRSDLRMVDVQGNVETRVRRLAELQLGGLVLAAAGLDRLSMGERIAQRFTVEEVVPAAGQGAIAVQVREDDLETGRAVERINDENTMRTASCERAFAKAIGGDCNVPAGAHATAGRGSLTLVGMIASPDGTRVLKRKAASSDPVALGESLAKELLALGGAEIIKAVP